jgi:predicted nucleotidyltransferase
MTNDDIMMIKNSILDAVGETCEKIILFGSHAYGTPREGSNYDFCAGKVSDTNSDEKESYGEV